MRYIHILLPNSYFKVAVFLSFQDMEENFKQVRLQDRQDQKHLEKKYRRKVSVLTICFAILFLNLYHLNDSVMPH